MVVLNDTVKLAEMVSDGYGDETIDVLTEVDALFLQSTGNVHNANTELINSDAHVYLDIENQLLLGRGYRIEGMFLIANPFGNSDDESWYKITRVVVGQRKLLTNEVDNVHAYLQKVAKP